MKNLELNEKSLVYHLKQYRAKKFLKYYPETTSTNDIAKKMCHEGKNKELFVLPIIRPQARAERAEAFIRRRVREYIFPSFMKLQVTKRILTSLRQSQGLL